MFAEVDERQHIDQHCEPLSDIIASLHIHKHSHVGQLRAKFQHLQRRQVVSE
jgi:hypothetical protein